MRKKNIFVTGGGGFIGRNIIEQLGGKYKFLFPTYKQLDLLNTSDLESFFISNKIDLVIHCAKLGGTRKDQNSLEIAKANLKMFFNIVRNKKYFKKMIFLGSGGEYDHSRSLVKVKEKEFDRVVPADNFFGFYKYICSKYIEEADNIINLRPFGIYGKYEDYKLRFISNAICRNILDLPITINQNVYFDYLYVNDFIKILDFFINNETKEKFYNIGKGKKIDLLTIAKKINLIADKKSEIIVKKEGLNKEYTCDNSLLKRTIKDLKFTNFEESIEKMYAWYKSIKPSLDIKSI